MADISAQEMASKLMSEGFARSGPVADALADPIADTPIVVTLDELRSYEFDPRLTRNPLYDEIKASIRERGLDAPPPITRRPGAPHYIIRNGGNTRLAILRELWTETKEERFFRIACVFRPWPERGEIVALTGHLAENELHGSLSFIERALGVEKVRELYEQETGKSLSQSELARRLRADGYPVSQPHISRMQEAIQHLLPAIPNVLYAGLGRHQVEQLTSLRRSAAKIWESRSASVSGTIDFTSLFQDVLVLFDGGASSFNVQRVQDELIGQMAELLGVQYDTLALEITDSDKRWQVLSREPASMQPAPPIAPLPTPPAPQRSPSSIVSTAPVPAPRAVPTPTSISGASDPSEALLNITPSADLDDPQEEHGGHGSILKGHIVSPAATTDRLQSIQRLIADHTGETPNDFESNVLRSIPVQAGGLYPISDVWHIEPSLDEPDRLRTHIAQFAQEIATEAGLDRGIVPCDDSIGFACGQAEASGDQGALAPLPRAVLALLHVLSAPYQLPGGGAARIDTSQLPGDLGRLLLGEARACEGRILRLSDNGLVKLFRLLRLARRLLDIEAGAAGGDAPARGP
ncbi:ParB family protein [Xanthomonas campestris pv. phormiicola]|nr:ParB family protein [Xanthomonas campestris pv. phormiicola]UYC17465.1 ParB family protein [Xanthomonas campestris pv. phormiicola]